jgi:hypothetical protein
MVEPVSRLKSEGRSTALAFTGLVLLLSVIAGSLHGQFGGGMYDSVGGKLSQGHANRSRWTAQRANPPSLALLWFPSDGQGMEAEAYTNGFVRIRSTKVLGEASSEIKLTSQSLREAELLLKKLPAESGGVELARQMRVSWAEGTEWHTRVYDRGNPPLQLQDLAMTIGIRLPVICPALPEHFAGHSEMFPGPREARAFACDQGILVVRQGEILLISPKDLSNPKSFPTPPLLTNNAENHFFGLSVTPDATRAAFSTAAFVAVHELQTGKEVWKHLLPPPPRVVSASISPDGSKLLVWQRKELVLHSTSKQFDAKKLAQSEQIESVAWSRDGKALAWGSDSRWNLCDGLGNITKTLSNSAPVTALAFSPDGREIAVASTLGWRVEVYDASTSARKFVVAPEVNAFSPESSPRSLVWSPDGRRLAVASEAGALVICDVSRRIPIGYCRMSIVSPAMFSADGRMIMAAGTDNLLHVWDLIR